MYSQNDPAWGGHVLGFGPAQFTIGSDGCYLTSDADLLTWAGRPTDPGQLNELYKQNGTFVQGDLLTDSALHDAFPSLWRLEEVYHCETVPCDQSKLDNDDPDLYVVVELLGPRGLTHFSPVTDWRQWVIADTWDGQARTIGERGRLWGWGSDSAALVGKVMRYRYLGGKAGKPMLMLDALFPPADPGQLIADMDQVGAEACLVYCWRPDGRGGIDIGSWTRAHVDRLHAAGKHAVGSVVPLPDGGDVGQQFAALAGMGIGPPALVSLDLEPPGLPPVSWWQAFDGERGRRGYGHLDYGTASNLASYPVQFPAWVASWLRTGALEPVPALPLARPYGAWQFVNDVRLQSGAVYDVSIVEPSIFGGDGVATLDPADPVVQSLEGTVGQIHNMLNWGTPTGGAVPQGWMASQLKAIEDKLASLGQATVDVDKLAAALAPHLQQVDEAKLVADLEAVLPAAEIAAFRAALLKALAG